MRCFRCRVCSTVTAPYNDGDEDVFCPYHPDGSVEVIDLPDDWVIPPAQDPVA